MVIHQYNNRISGARDSRMMVLIATERIMRQTQSKQWTAIRSNSLPIMLFNKFCSTTTAAALISFVFGRQIRCSAVDATTRRQCIESAERIPYQSSASAFQTFRPFCNGCNKWKPHTKRSFKLNRSQHFSIISCRFLLGVRWCLHSAHLATYT